MGHKGGYFIPSFLDVIFTKIHQTDFNRFLEGPITVGKHQIDGSVVISIQNILRPRISWERVFWIKSSPPISFAEAKQIPNSLSWLLSPTHWKQLLEAIQQDIITNPIIYVTGIFCFMSLLYLAYNVRQQLRIINKEIIRSSFRKFGIYDIYYVYQA